MNSLLHKLYIPSHIEYLIINTDLIIVDISPRIHRFADAPEHIQIGQDARLSFPELVGSEAILEQIFTGQNHHFYLEGLARSTSDDTPLYIDLNFEPIGDKVIILMEDVTEIMILKQSLVQRANEAELLLSALTASEDYNKKIISSMGDALFVTTSSGRIKTINRAAQRLFEYSEDDLVGKPISLIIADQNFLFRASQQNLLSSEFLTDVEVICHTKTGRELIVEFSCSVIQTTSKGFPAFVYIGRDITVRKQVEAEMNKALAKEKELNDLKSRFISMTSHEFRSPLSSILMSVELLDNFSEQWSDEKKNRYLQRIKQCTINMTNLLEDILIIGRAEAGKIDLKPNWLDFIEFCQDIVEEIQLIAGSEYTIQLAYPDKLKEKKLWLDEKMLRHILTNLLTNAIKYSPGGGKINFEIAVQEKTLILMIQDQGIGIPPADQEHLFECFHRAKNVGNISGTGLGLSIVKKSVDLHGGNISFASEVGKGTTFWVNLPFSVNPLKSSARD